MLLSWLTSHPIVELGCKGSRWVTKVHRWRHRMGWDGVEAVKAWAADQPAGVQCGVGPVVVVLVVRWHDTGGTGAASRRVAGHGARRQPQGTIYLLFLFIVLFETLTSFSYCTRYFKAKMSGGESGWSLVGWVSKANDILSYLRKQNIRLCECTTAITTKRLDKCLRNFAHSLFGENSRFSSLIGKIAITVSKWQSYIISKDNELL